MATRDPYRLKAEAVLEHEGTVSIGEYSLVQSGSSVGGRIPLEYARPLGVDEAETMKTYVNFELGVVVHRLPNGEAEASENGTVEVQQETDR